eukprot:NODE_15634_length_1039_cov_5.241228.p1 GENE.NODE_15634_length_1039_cov_5.241228~~NODE_15634_length_1039_cov_5.241228.p1  ORF type:complete len:244 (-),score=60.09 NODE_15634_length_1039_cov_5.241228:227-958(-)
MASPAGFTFTTDAGERVVVNLVIMDCDGVIFDSNNIKTAAYRDAIAAIDGVELAERFVHEIHLRDVSVARRVKFEEYFSQMAPRPEGSERNGLIDRAFREYSAAVERGYHGLKPVPPALEIARRARTYVVSGGDHAELQGVFAHHGITDEFVEVRGSGVGGATKPVHVEEILRKEGADVKTILFIGDGWTDFKTAQQYAIHFAFLREMSDWHAWRDQSSDASVGSMSTLETWGDLLARTVVHT